MDSGSRRETILRRVEQALATMDERALAVFERARYRDLDNRAIAAELGLTINQVERALTAALVHVMRHVDGGGRP
jgi:DNA-directed RNA polymerase specialized sigma24 family protein